MNSELRAAAERFVAITDDDATEADSAGATGRAIVDGWQEFKAAQEIVRVHLTECERHEHNARDALRRWEFEDAETCVDPVLAVCQLAEKPIDATIQANGLGGTRG